MNDPKDWAFWVQIPPTRGMQRVTFQELRMVLAKTGWILVEGSKVRCCFCKSEIFDFDAEDLSGGDYGCPGCTQNYLDGLKEQKKP